MSAQANNLFELMPLTIRTGIDVLFGIINNEVYGLIDQCNGDLECVKKMAVQSLDPKYCVLLSDVTGYDTIDRL